MKFAMSITFINFINGIFKELPITYENVTFCLPPIGIKRQTVAFQRIIHKGISTINYSHLPTRCFSIDLVLIQGATENKFFF